MNRRPYLFIFFIFLAITILMAVAIKGDHDPLYFQTHNDTRVGGPLEVTNSSSRYVLIQAMADRHTFGLTDQEALTALPDAVNVGGRYFSIFTPGVSFIGLPFYILGQTFHFPQLTTFVVTILVAILNVWLICRLAVRWGASLGAGLIGGMIFLFATNAFAYALTLTQHHFSTTLILLGLLNAMGERTVIKNIVLGALFGMGLLLDIPNAFLLAPIVVYVLLQHFQLAEKEQKIQLAVKYIFLWMVIGLIPFLALFGWYNYKTMGSPLVLAQIAGRATGLPGHEDVEPKIEKPQDPFDTHSKFQTRKILNGLHVLMIGNERSWRYYSPVILLSVVAFFFKQRDQEVRRNIFLTLTVIVVNILIYAMFSDPWGGWSFGARYLIPAAALMATFLALFVERYKRNVWLMFVFVAMLIWSIHISALGAITTTAIPPKGAALALPNPVPYTYVYNEQIIAKNETSSLVYNWHLFKYLKTNSFWHWYTALISVVVLAPYGLYLSAQLRRRLRYR